MTHRSMMARSRWDRLVALSGLLLVLGFLVAVMPRNAGAASDVEWKTYDVDITVDASGDLHVVERQVVRFQGRYSSGFAEIPLANLTEIDNVEVAVGNSANATPVELDYKRSSRYDSDPGTYTYNETGSSLEIDYAFTPTSYSGSEERLIVVSYDVIGALRVYDDVAEPNQQLWWMAISSDVTDIAPVDAATVSVTLPQEVSSDQIQAEPADPSVDGATYTWTQRDLGEGDQFEIGLYFPIITSATAQDWQIRDDQIQAEREKADERSAVAGVFLFAAGALLSIGGGIALFAIWYSFGRDPQVGPVAEYLPEPPDDLGPGAAGTLIDENVNARDVISSVVDLAKRGVLQMDETNGSYTYTLKEHGETLDHSEQRLLDAIFGLSATAGKAATMAQIQATFVASQETIHEGYYDELVSRGYFRQSPAAQRRRWRTLAWGIPVVAAAVAIAIPVLAGGMSGWIAFPIFAGVVLFVAALMISRVMPKKTLEGAEAAAKWRAFKTYLDDIEKYENLEESKQIFDKYLPYAVAFGLESTWVQKFAAVNTPAPEWFGGDWVGGPMRTGTGRRMPQQRGGTWIFTGDPFSQGGSSQQRRSSSGGGTQSSGDGGGFDMPDLQDMSDRGGRSLQGASDSFLGMLETAAKAFSSGSGGGSSRGSFGGHRSSGGGSRSSGGGGRSGGSSGGGKRGFR